MAMGQHILAGSSRPNKRINFWERYYHEFSNIDHWEWLNDEYLAHTPPFSKADEDDILFEPTPRSSLARPVS